MIVVVMGVASAGKTRVAKLIEKRAGWRRIEGDDLHPEANREKMSAGTPLTDEDRWPWLDAIGSELAKAAAEGASLVVTCSALKRGYRDRLRSHCPELRFLHLHGPKTLLQQRMSGRKGHFMPASLLPSQLATLEMPGKDETDVIHGDIRRPVDRIVDKFLREVGT